MKMTTNDQDLLAGYLREQLEDAFAVLVSRHLNLVYSAALRQVRSPQLAEEVSQSVFTDLARNATKLKADTILTAWLYQVTRRTAIDVVRRESRRQARERIAAEMAAMNTATDWNQIEPLLDEGMDALDETDRTAILLRYFDNKSLREVGEALGTSDDAAQKRVSRAVERLREIFTKRGVAVGAGGLTAAVSANAVQAAPAGLAAAFTSAAFAGATATSGTGLTIWKIMTLTKLKMGMAAAIIAAGVATSVMIQQQAQARMRAQDELWRRQSQQIAKLKADNERLPVKNGSTGGNNLAALEKLRAEVGALRGKTNGLAKLRDENHRLRAFAPPSLEGKTALEAAENAQVDAIAKLNYSRQLCLACIMYAADYQGQTPTNFDGTKCYFNTNNANTNLTLDKFAWVYGGALSNIPNPAETILIRETDATQTPHGNWIKVYGFADGHAVVHSEPDGNFDAFEAQHIIPQASQ